MSFLRRMRRLPFLKPSDSLSVVLLGDPLAAPLAVLLARCGVRANWVTIGGAIVGIAGGAFLAMGRSTLAGGLLFVGFVVDCADGDVARIRGEVSDFGGRLDLWADRVRKAAFFAGFLIGLIRTGQLSAAAVGVVLVAVHYGLHRCFWRLWKRLPENLRTASGRPEAELTGWKARLSAMGVDNLFSFMEEQFVVCVLGPITGHVLIAMAVGSALFGAVNILPIVRILWRARARASKVGSPLHTVVTPQMQLSPSTTNGCAISVCLINFRYHRMLLDCIRTIAASKAQASYEIVAVNKLDGRNVRREAEAMCPQIKWIDSTEPFTIAGYRNMAMRVARGHYILNLDTDCLVHQGMLDEAVRFMDRSPAVGCAGGQLLRRDGSVQYSCRTFYSLPIVLMRRTPLRKMFPNSRIERDHLMADWDHRTERPVDWVGGGFMVIRREAMDQVALLDEDYAYGFEDVDYCYRMWLAGWEVYYCPAACVVHFENRPSFGLNRLALEHLKSGLKFWWKHHGTFHSNPRLEGR